MAPITQDAKGHEVTRPERGPGTLSQSSSLSRRKGTSLVSGGAGFIGSHLCERLLQEGQRVICVDNLLTGREHNLEHLVGREGFEFVRHDVIEPRDWQADYIFHLASPASPPGYLKYPLETLLVNSVGSRNLLELALRHGARFLMASTSEIYGDPLQHPQTETYWGNVNPIGERSCYDEGKRFGEAITMAYVRKHGLDARVIRIFNTYGPRSDPNDGRIVPNFVTQALRGQPITVFGDGQQTRSLCYVSDLVEGVVKAMFSPGTQGEVFNLGNPDEHTVLEYAQLIREACGSRSEIVFRPIPIEDDPQRRRPDITKARTILGWEPSVDLRRGLEATVAWFRSRLAIV